MNNRSKPNAFCYVCDEKGHYANKCPNRLDSCYICGEKNHYASKCLNKDKKSSSEQMFLCSFVARTKTENEWFIDSGASAHMTMYETILSETRSPVNSEIVVTILVCLLKASVIPT